jgi:beta-phosphoglucomutase-like phosphatase (HAD superfamily)
MPTADSPVFPDLGTFAATDGIRILDSSSDQRFVVGVDGVTAVAATGDGKVEFVAFERHTLACVRSAMGHPAYYPVLPVSTTAPVRALLMDLDGTSVRSEGFWVWIIQRSVSSLLGDPGFELEDEDLPYVSGHSVSEHLQYCVGKYCPDRTVEQARDWYYRHTEREMAAILKGEGRCDAFEPTPGLKPFLLELRRRGILIALVTSGLHQKAWPEIVSAFRQLDMGDPAAFYDAIVTAGTAIRRGRPGTLGELSPKPHPWLYAEACRVGLGLGVADRGHVLGLEDSGAGVCSIRLAGYAPLGLDGGNIDDSGTRALCHGWVTSLEQVVDWIDALPCA